MAYFALPLSDNAIHFQCNAAAAPGVLPRGGRRSSCASGSLLSTSSFLHHGTLVKRNLVIRLTDRITDYRWMDASVLARNVSSPRVFAVPSEGTVTVEEPASATGESLVEEDNAAEKNVDAPRSCVETKHDEATEASVDTPTKPTKQSKLRRSNGRAAAAKNLKIRTIQKELIPGAVFAGKVRAVQAYGAFVDIGAFADGLLHISQLSSNYVAQVQDVVSVGQEVIVRVVDVDEMAGRISLTMQDEKKAEDQQTQRLRENQSGDSSGSQQEDAAKTEKITGKRSRERGKWDEQQKVGKLRKNQELQGKVKKIIRSGVFVELVDGQEGFIRTSRIAVGGDENVSAETSLLHIGQEVKVRVVKIERGKVILTMMREEEEVAMKSINSSINKIQNVVDASNNDAFELNFRMANSIGNRTHVLLAAEESSIQKKSVLPEEQASPEIQEAITEDQVASPEQPPLTDFVGVTTQGIVINQNGDMGVSNPFELDSCMPPNSIGNTTQVAYTTIEMLGLLEEQASAEFVEETDNQGEDVIPMQQLLGDLVEATAGIGIVPEDKLETRLTPDEEPPAKLSDTNKELLEAAENAISAELVEVVEEGIAKLAYEESENGNFVLPEEQASTQLEEEMEAKAQDVIPEQKPIASRMEATEGIDVVTEDILEATLAPDEESRAEFSGKTKEILEVAKEKISSDLGDATEEIENQVAFEMSSMEKLGVPEEQASMELGEETEDKTHDALLDQQLVAYLAEAKDGIDVLSEYELETGMSPDEEPSAKLGDIKELVDSAEDRMDAEFVDATEGTENEMQVASNEWLIKRFELAEEQALSELEEEIGVKAQDAIPEQQSVTDLAEATDGIDVMIEDESEAGMTPGEELRAEPSATNKELINSDKDNMGTDLVEMTAVIENDTDVSKEPPVDRLEMSEEQAFAELCEETEHKAANVIPEEKPLADLTEGTDRIDVLIEEFRAELSDMNKELNDLAEDKIVTTYVEVAAEMEKDTQVVSNESPTRALELLEEQASAEVEEETEDKAEDVTPERQPVADHGEATEGIYITTIDELETGMTPDEEPRAAFRDTNNELVDAMEGIENDTQIVCDKSSINRLELPEEQTSAVLQAETQDKAEEKPVVDLAEAADGIDVVIEDEFEALITPAEESTAELIDTIKELVNSAKENFGTELVEATAGIESDIQVVSKDLSVDRLELLEEQASAKIEEEREHEVEDVIHEDVVHGLKSVVDIVEATTGGIDFAIEETRAELSDTNNELLDSANDKTGVEHAEATIGSENIFEVKVELTSTLNQQLLADAQIGNDLVQAVQSPEKSAELAAEEMTLKNKFDAVMEEKQEEVSIPVNPEEHSIPVKEANYEFAPSLAMDVQVLEIAATNPAAEAEEALSIPEAGEPSPLIPGAFALDTDSMTNATLSDPRVDPKHSQMTEISGWQHLWHQFFGTQ